MTIKSKIILMLSLAPLVQTKASSLERDSLYVKTAINEDLSIAPIKPTYLSGVSYGSTWGSNWFLNVQGGASAFLGTPIGCADLFDRTMPVLQINVGKWFTPAIGGRIAYQGLKFKDSNLDECRYTFVHADFMLNVTSSVRVNDHGLSRWDVIPFAGVGIIHNKDFRSTCSCTGLNGDAHPFAFAYGLQGRYRLTNRFHITAELSGMTTFRSFDSKGVSCRFGDNMINLSAGLSLTIGKAGWSRVIDAKPYMEQNEWLMDHINRLFEENRYLTLQNAEDQRIIEEYRKILEIEGFLDIYSDSTRNGRRSVRSIYPRNDYSGLNSLRARMSNRGWDGNSETMPKAMKKRGESYDRNDLDGMESFFNSDFEDDIRAYLMSMAQSGEGIGAPVYFFFNIGTAALTDESQLLNLDEIAKVVKKYSLKVKVTGAADSATGTDSINDTLSHKRAQYIKDLLVERGVVDEHIKTVSEGGIDDYSPVQANRNTSIILTF